MTSFRPVLALALLLGAATPSRATAQHVSDADRARAFDTYVARAMRDWQVPGLAIAVVKDGRVVFEKGYGVRKLGDPAPVDTNTLFEIASTTKAMTVTALAMLVDEHKIQWDDRASQYLPALQFTDPYVTKEATIRDLLTHRTGLGNADLLWAAMHYPQDEILRRVRYIPMDYSMRSSFEYSNIMYGAAGALIKPASDTAWDAFVRARIFAPIGMTRSQTSVESALAAGNYATPHWRFGGDTVVAIDQDGGIDGLPSAGAVWSSAADMSKWVRFLLDTGRVGDKQLVSRAALSEMWTPQQIIPRGSFYPTTKLTHPHWTTYGLAWFQQDYAGQKLDFHTGSLNGAVAIVGLVRDKDFGVVVLANRDHAELRHALMFEAVDRWLGLGEHDWSASMRAMYDSLERANAEADRKEASAHDSAPPSLPLARYAGTYTDSIYGPLTVTADTVLHVTFGSLKGIARPWGYDNFRVTWEHRWDGASNFGFTVDPAGKPVKLDLDGVAFTPGEPSVTAAP